MSQQGRAYGSPDVMKSDTLSPGGYCRLNEGSCRRLVLPGNVSQLRDYIVPPNNTITLSSKHTAVRTFPPSFSGMSIHRFGPIIALNRRPHEAAAASPPCLASWKNDRLVQSHRRTPEAPEPSRAATGRDPDVLFDDPNASLNRVTRSVAFFRCYISRCLSPALCFGVLSSADVDLRQP